MGISLDHLAVSAGTLADGVEYVEDLLAVSLSGGGEHPQMGTRNRLLSLGPDIYLEVIAINPEAEDPGRTRWFDLDRFSGPPRLTNWIARCDDLAAARARAPDGIGDKMNLRRDDLRWQMAVPANGQLPFGGMYPALIFWGETMNPATRLPDRGCRLAGFEIFHPDADGLRTWLDPVFGADAPRITQAPKARLEARIATPRGERLLC